MNTIIRASLALLCLASASALAHEETPTSGSSSVVTATGEGTRNRWAERFNGSILILDQSTTPETLSPGLQLSQGPSYQWWFSFRPRFYITKNLSLRGRADLTLEWTNAGAETTHYREPQFGDIWTDLVYSGIPKFLGIQASVGLRGLWGTSLGSQMEGSIVKVGPTFGLLRTFESKKVGSLELSGGASLTYSFNKSTSAGLSGNNQYACQSLDIGSPLVCDGNTAGMMNAPLQLVTYLGIKYAPISRLSFSVTYLFIDKWLYGTPDATVTDASGGTTVVQRSPDDQRLREAGWFLASADLDVQKWISLSLGYYVYQPILKPDGTYGNPLWSPGGNSRIFFTMTFALDEIIDAVARPRHSTVSPPLALSPTSTQAMR